MRYAIYSKDLKGVVANDCDMDYYLHLKQYVLSETSYLYGAKFVATKRVKDEVYFKLRFFKYYFHWKPEFPRSWNMAFTWLFFQIRFDYGYRYVLDHVVKDLLNE